MNFIRTDNGLLNLEQVVEFWIYPGDENASPEIVAITLARDDSGSATFITVSDCCCMDSAHAKLDKLHSNIASNRLLDSYEVDCPNVSPSYEPSFKGAN